MNSDSEGRASAAPPTPTRGETPGLASELHWFLGVLAFAAALLLAPALGGAHVDDSDAQLYQVIVRHQLEDHTWFDLRYLPEVHPRFREHLPFGLWPAVAWARIFGERGLGLVSVLWSLATVALVSWMGWRLRGRAAGIGAGLLLAGTETFFVYGSRLRLDPPLAFFATLAAVPFLVPTTRLAGAWAVLGGALATAVKGPFGLLPLLAAALGRAAATRRLAPVIWGGVAALLAALPVVAFLLGDRLLGEGTWWSGYVEHQLLASASGAREDGERRMFAAVASVVSRFWPGLPLALVGLGSCWRGAEDDGPTTVQGRTVAWACLFAVLALGLPGRFVWNHALVIYPLLALLGGLGCHALAVRLRRPRWSRRLPLLWCLTAMAWVAALAGAGRLLVKTPCLASRELASGFERLAAGTPVLVVAEKPQWGTVASLAAERRLRPRPSADFSPASSLSYRWALAQESSAPTVAGWSERSRARGWVLWEREDQASPPPSPVAPDPQRPPHAGQE